MKKILSSLFMLGLTVTLVSAATKAVFSDQAVLGDNTFSTGVLEIRVNHQERATGFNFANAIPGDCIDGTFEINNFNAANFGGPSTLDADELVISSHKTSGSSPLYNNLTVEIGADRGWGSWMPVYNGPLKDLSESDLLLPRWTSLPNGWSEVVKYNVCLPLTAPTSLQGTSTVFDFLVDAYTPSRT